MDPKRFYATKKCIAIGAGLLVALASFADPLNEAITTETATNKNSARSQQKISEISNQTRQMIDEYRMVVRQTETLKSYNDNLRQLVASQQQEKKSIKKQLQEIDTTQREIVPLMMRMSDTLESFVELDTPFLPDERRQRVTRLKDLMARADVTNAEKFRQILEAFQIENDYGHTIEAYRGELDLSGTSRTVDFLRLGRLGFYYQSLDGSATGMWNRETKQWEDLPEDYGKPVQNGLRIARKQAAPDLLNLPIPAPEAAK